MKREIYLSMVGRKFRIEKKIDESKAELYKLYSKAYENDTGSAQSKKD